MPLKAAEFVILAVLCDGELHGNEIMQAVYRKTNGGLMLRSTSLYGVLRGLTNRGLIQAVKKSQTQQGTSGNRTYYRITQTGRKVVQDDADARASGR